MSRSELGGYAFQYCSSLQAVCNPSSIALIAHAFFSYCTEVRKVTFESGSKLSSLGQAAFSYCSSLRSVCPRETLPTIDLSCFRYCDALLNATFESKSLANRVSRLYIASAAFRCVIDSVFLLETPDSNRSSTQNKNQRKSCWRVFNGISSDHDELPERMCEQLSVLPCVLDVRRVLEVLSQLPTLYCHVLHVPQVH